MDTEEVSCVSMADGPKQTNVLLVVDRLPLCFAVSSRLQDQW